MALSLRHWRARHLLAAWSAYWVGLVLVTLGEPLRLMWRLTRVPDNHGSFSANFGDGLLKLTIVEGGRTVWSGATEPGTAIAWLAGPPLLLWLLWLVLRSRAPAEGPSVRQAPPPAVGAGTPGWERPAPARPDAATRPPAGHEQP